MTRPLAKSPVVLLALGLWMIACPASLPEDDDPNALNQQVNQLIEQGKYQEAIPIAKRALEVAKRARGPENPDTAQSLNNLGELYQVTGEYAKAEPLYQEALRIRRKVLGAEHPYTATSLNDLGELYQATDEYAKAEPLLQEALRIRQKVLGAEHPATATSLNSLALLYQDMGEYTKAEPLYQEALRIRQKVLGAEHPATAAGLNNLGNLYHDLGEYAKAEALLQEALRIRQKVLGAEHLDTATSLNNLALLYQDMGENTTAEPLCKEALQIRQKVLGSEHPATATSLNNLGKLYDNLGEYSKAEVLLREALRIRQKVFGSEDPATATSLNNLGKLYGNLGEYTKAEPLLQEALRIRQKVLGAEHPATATSLNDLALLYRAMGEYAKAEPLLQEALRIRQKVLGTQHPDTAATLDSLAWLNVEMGKFDEAREFARRRDQAVQNSFQSTLSSLSERERLAYVKRVDPYSLFAAATGGEIDLALAMLRYKGSVLDSIIEDFSDAKESKKTETQRLLEQLRNHKTILAQLLFQRSNPDEIRPHIEQLASEIEQIESQLAQNISSGRIANRSFTATIEQVQAALPESSALIDFLQYRHSLGKDQFELRYGAMILLKQGAPRWVPLDSGIDRLVKAYRQILTGAGDDNEMTHKLRALYQALWKPIQGSLPEEIKSVIISPDGRLNSISFATLVAEDGKFLAEKYLIRYVTSGRDLLRSGQSPVKISAILFANPVFELNNSAARVAEPSMRKAPEAPLNKPVIDLTEFSFEPLYGTRRECDELTARFKAWRWETEAFTGPAASKTNLWQIHSPTILHIATHSFFVPPDESDEPTLIKAGHWDFETSSTDPMFRSALVLAGAQAMIDAERKGENLPGDDNGIATAEEIGTMDLGDTWLVTLSTGDFGGEVIPGEGVLGLARGFFEAGAQHVLMALSALSDEATVDFMKDFYDAVRESGNAPLAMAQVQRKWLVKFREERGLAKAVTLAGPFVMISKVR